MVTTSKNSTPADPPLISKRKIQVLPISTSLKTEDESRQNEELVENSDPKQELQPNPPGGPGLENAPPKSSDTTGVGLGVTRKRNHKRITIPILKYAPGLKPLDGPYINGFFINLDDHISEISDDPNEKENLPFSAARRFDKHYKVMNGDGNVIYWALEYTDKESRYLYGQKRDFSYFIFSPDGYPVLHFQKAVRRTDFCCNCQKSQLNSCCCCKKRKNKISDAMSGPDHAKMSTEMGELDDSEHLCALSINKLRKVDKITERKGCCVRLPEGVFLGQIVEAGATNNSKSASATSCPCSVKYNILDARGITVMTITAKGSCSCCCRLWYPFGLCSVTQLSVLRCGDTALSVISASSNETNATMAGMATQKLSFLAYSQIGNIFKSMRNCDVNLPENLSSCFGLNFPANLRPVDKALLLASILYMNVRYFERRPSYIVCYYFLTFIVISAVISMCVYTIMSLYVLKE